MPFPVRISAFLIDAYLASWAKASRDRPRQLWVIDAQAGSGLDAPGSLSAAVIAAEHARVVNGRHFPIPLPAGQGVRVLALEARAAHYDRLTLTLGPYTIAPTIVKTLRGAIHQQLTTVMATIGDNSALTLLDPFAHDGVPAAVLSELLGGRHSELLIMYSSGPLGRPGNTEGPGPMKPFHDNAAPLACCVEDRLGSEAATPSANRQEVDRLLAGLSSTESACAIASRAFARPIRGPISDIASRERRRRHLLDRYIQLLAVSGARHVLPFTIAIPAHGLVATILHASKHPNAVLAMKDTLHRARTRRTKRTVELIGTAGLHTASLATESRRMIDATLQQVHQQFAGRMVRWYGATTHGSVVAYLRAQTTILDHEWPVVLGRLIAANLAAVLRPSPLTVCFAEAATDDAIDYPWPRSTRPRSHMARARRI